MSLGRYLALLFLLSCPVVGACPLEPGVWGSISLGRQVLSKNGWSGL